MTTPEENEEVELMECEATMSEDIQPLDEDADETLLSQASRISDPEQEVSIWCETDALNDALGNLTSGRFSPILSTFKNASFHLPSKSTTFARPGKMLQLRCQSLVPGKKKTIGNVYPK